MIRAIIFDFGNVISSFDISIFQRRLLPYTDLTLEELQALREPVSRLAVRYETGLITSREFFDGICDVGGLWIPMKDFINAYTSMFTPIESTHALIRALKPHYQLGMLSNTNEWHYTHNIRTVDVFPLFDAVTLSYEVKAMKPARAMYDDMVNKLAVAPEECVYIDDLRENAVAAAAMGMHAIHYTTASALMADLQRLGVVLTP